MITVHIMIQHSLCWSTDSL